MEVLGAGVIGLAIGYFIFSGGSSAKREVKKAEATEKQQQQQPQQKKKKDAPRGDYKMVLLVRTDLKMGVGKVAAQCGHATLGAYKRAMKHFPDVVSQWSHTGQAKIALKVSSEEEMLELEKRAQEKGLCTYVVMDAGRTQIEEGTQTVCAVGPGPVAEINEVTGHLKLL